MVEEFQPKLYSESDSEMHFSNPKLVANDRGVKLEATVLSSSNWNARREEHQRYLDDEEIAQWLAVLEPYRDRLKFKEIEANKKKAKEWLLRYYNAKKVCAQEELAAACLKKAQSYLAEQNNQDSFVEAELEALEERMKAQLKDEAEEIRAALEDEQMKD